MEKRRQERAGIRTTGQQERAGTRTRGQQERQLNYKIKSWWLKNKNKNNREQRATDLQQEMFRRYKENRDFEQATGSYRV